MDSAAFFASRNDSLALLTLPIVSQALPATTKIENQVVANGARGIAAGLAATEWEILLQLDLFHLLHEAHPISKRLERTAYQAIEEANQARLVLSEAQIPRRRGKPRQANCLWHRRNSRNFYGFILYCLNHANYFMVERPSNTEASVNQDEV